MGQNQSLSGKLWDAGTYERHQQGDEIVLDETMTAGVKRARVLTVMVLERYFRRNELCATDEKMNANLYAAGLRLRTDFEKAGLTPRTIASYQASTTKSSSGSEAISETRLNAYQEWQLALKAVGPIAADECVEACCCDENVGKDRMVLLRRGLKELAYHYGILRRG